MMCTDARLIFLLALSIQASDAFLSTTRHHHHNYCRIRQPLYEQFQLAATDETAYLNEEVQISLSAHSAAGINDDELPTVLSAITTTCHEFGIPFDHSNLSRVLKPKCPNSLPGCIGRVLLIHVSGINNAISADVNDIELITQLKLFAWEEIDTLLSSSGDEIEWSNYYYNRQPILLAFRDEKSNDGIEDVIVKECADYGLTDSIINFVDGQYNEEGGGSSSSSTSSVNTRDEFEFIPSQHIQIDGAHIQTMDATGATHRNFDTSSVIVLDNLISESLRQRLLNVVKGYPEDITAIDDIWDDVEFGPNPERWERGGLMDTISGDDDDDDDTDNDQKNDEATSDGSSCWGLTPEAIEDLCYPNKHSAISEFESILSQLFADFTVTRLPEAVFGDSISPITANAPTNGDSFDYHIDADPLQVPPSPWSDVFGRYPNRSRGKPRFVSVLLYLNDEWKEEWGAPTRFLDPPTGEEVDIIPRPGRCVVMDQDISHTVVAPNVEAGKRPRYSLVWKLILHPKRVDQDMSDLCCGRTWPEPQVVGSANGSVVLENE
jgi:hypothetical protein